MTLSPADARATVLAVLGGIAPEADLAALDSRANMRRALDLDSVDFQNFLISLVKATGVDIPDRIAPTLVTLDACVGHLTGHAVGMLHSSAVRGPGFMPPPSPFGRGPG